MKPIVYTFMLEGDEAIVMELIGIYDTKEIFYSAFANVFFYQQDMCTLLTYDMLHEHCLLLTILCKKALRRENTLNEELMSDVGFLYNNVFYKSVHTNYKDLQTEKLCNDLSKYLLWSPILSKNNMKTWMYNNGNGQIILFIAPVYPFTFSSKRVKGYISYEEWIKTYKPFIKRIIPPDVVYKWIQQAEEVMVLMEKNSRPYLE
jgi:hypothetical protein